MRKGQLSIVILAAVAAILLIAGSSAQAGTVTYYYPTQEAKVFSVTAPDDWELTPPEEDGDFFMLTGPTGMALSFRAIDPDSGSSAGEDAGNYIKENYKNVQMKEPIDCSLGDLPGKCLAGHGESEDGTKYGFLVAWVVLKNGQVAELWYEVEMTDKEGAAAGDNILKTFKSY